MTYQQAIEELLAYEMDHTRAPDGRRVIRDERIALMAAHQMGRSTRERILQAIHVLEMWR
jgi:hypothetical protein